MIQEIVQLRSQTLKILQPKRDQLSRESCKASLLAVLDNLNAAILECVAENLKKHEKTEFKELFEDGQGSEKVSEQDGAAHSAS